MSKRAGKHKNRRRGRGHQKRRAQLRKLKLLSVGALKVVFQEVTSPERLLTARELIITSPGTPVLDEGKIAGHPGKSAASCSAVGTWEPLELAIQPLPPPNCEISEDPNVLSAPNMNECVGETSPPPPATDLSPVRPIPTPGDVRLTPIPLEEDSDVLWLDSPGQRLFLECAAGIDSVFRSPRPVTPGRDLEARARAATTPRSFAFSPVPDVTTPPPRIDAEDIPIPVTPGRWIDILLMLEGPMSP